jgi:hypothetical protein
MGATLTRDRHGVHITYERGTTMSVTFSEDYTVTSATFAVYEVGNTSPLLNLTSSPAAGVTITTEDGTSDIEVEMSAIQGNALDLGDSSTGRFLLLETLADGTQRRRGIFTFSEKDRVP